MTITTLARRITTFAGIVTLATVATVYAQMSKAGQLSRGPIEFTTTFPFTVGNATLPAGTYSLSPDDDDSGLFQLNGRQASAFFELQNARETTAPARSEVVFARHGSDYVLKNVWLAGSTEGLESVVTESERHHIAGGGAPGETRVLATVLKAPKSR